jgi:hypothetical protein
MITAHASTFVPTISWVGTADGFWDDATNWRDTAGVSRLPNASDDVLIDVLGASPTVTIRSNESVHSLLARACARSTHGYRSLAHDRCCVRIGHRFFVA